MYILLFFLFLFIYFLSLPAKSVLQYTKDGNRLVKRSTEENKSTNAS